MGILRYPKELMAQRRHDHSLSVAEAPAPVVEVDIRSAYNGTEYAGLEQDLNGLSKVSVGIRLSNVE